MRNHYHIWLVHVKDNETGKVKQSAVFKTCEEVMKTFGMSKSTFYRIYDGLEPRKKAHRCLVIKQVPINQPETTTPTAITV